MVITMASQKTSEEVRFDTLFRTFELLLSGKLGIKKEKFVEFLKRELKEKYEDLKEIEDINISKEWGLEIKYKNYEEETETITWSLNERILKEFLYFLNRESKAIIYNLLGKKGITIEETLFGNMEEYEDLVRKIATAD